MLAYEESPIFAALPIILCGKEGVRMTYKKPTVLKKEQTVAGKSACGLSGYGKCGDQVKRG